MSGNPELRRNLWLELTPQRLAAMPLVLGVLLALAVVGNDGAWDRGVALPAGFAFGALVLLWGTRLAAGSILDEAAGRTWDGQRLSSLGAWEMTWGKLAGSTAYPWYGGGFCLAVFVSAGLGSWPPRRVAIVSACLVAAGILSQAGALFVALLSLRNSPEAPARRSQGAGFLPVIAALWALGHIPRAFQPGRDPLVWFDLPVPAPEFLLASLLLFAAWAVVGAWSLMRVELRIAAAPGTLPAFVLFAMTYFAGLAPHLLRSAAGDAASLPEAPRLGAAFAVALVACYVAALVEPKDPVAYRRALGLWRSGARGEALAAAPRWLHVLPLALAAGTAAALAPLFADPAAARWWRPALIVAGALGFAARDVALVLGLNLGGKPKRADAAGLLSLALLYGAFPPLCDRLFGTRAFDLFYPTGRSLLAVIAPAAQTAAALAFLAARWRRWSRPPGA